MHLHFMRSSEATLDAQGLSFHSDAAIGRRLTLDLVTLSAPRQTFIQTDLIAYRKPLYQVLSLPETPQAAPSRLRNGRSVTHVHATTPSTTFPNTSVSRKSRPW